MPSDKVAVVVGRVGRAHGLAGDVTVEERTDDPEGRFALGSTLTTDPVDRGPLVVERVRRAGGRLVLAFRGVADRTAAESLRDVLLLVSVDPAARPADPEEFYDYQLVGCSVVTVQGRALGEVTDVLHLPGQDVLAVAVEGREVLVPFVSAIVPEVDLDRHLLTVDPPPGLLGDEGDG